MCTVVIYKTHFSDFFTSLLAFLQRYVKNKYSIEVKNPFQYSAKKIDCPSCTIQPDVLDPEIQEDVNPLSAEHFFVSDFRQNWICYSYWAQKRFVFLRFQKKMS